MKKILVSECLYGEKTVRYDGLEKKLDDPIFSEWKEAGLLVPVCPEMLGGLGLPRPEAQIVGTRVMNIRRADVTENYLKGAKLAFKIAEENDVVMAIMKESSPSCGVTRIHDGTFTGNKVRGEGVATGLLRAAGIKVFSEKRLIQAKEYYDYIIKRHQKKKS